MSIIKDPIAEAARFLDAYDDEGSLGTRNWTPDETADLVRQLLALAKDGHEFKQAGLREALEALWIWATEGRADLITEPVPDGLGAQVIAALSGGDSKQEAATTLIEGIPGTRIRANGDGTFDRIWPDGRVERVPMKRTDIWKVLKRGRIE